MRARSCDSASDGSSRISRSSCSMPLRSTGTGTSCLSARDPDWAERALDEAEVTHQVARLRVTPQQHTQFFVAAPQASLPNRVPAQAPPSPPACRRAPRAAPRRAARSSAGAAADRAPRSPGRRTCWLAGVAGLAGLAERAGRSGRSGGRGGRRLGRRHGGSSGLQVRECHAEGGIRAGSPTHPRNTAALCGGSSVRELPSPVAHRTSIPD